MGKADNLRFRDVRAAFHLIGECCELGAEPSLWHHQMLEGLAPLLGAVFATGGEGFRSRAADSAPSATSYRVVSTHCVGGDRAVRERFFAYHRDAGPAADPIYEQIGHLRGRLITRTRRQLVDDRVWYRSGSFVDYRRPVGLDQQLTSVWRARSASGAISVVTLSRQIGDRAFSQRERRLLACFHAELGRLLGGPLVSGVERELEGLPARLQETLACLIEGDSEKQVAARLGISPATVHQYVTGLHRHFGVHSRSELLVHVLRRKSRRASKPGAGTDPSNPTDPGESIGDG